MTMSTSCRAPRGEAELTTLQAELDRRLAVANVGAPITIDAESDVKTSTVRLNVPSAPTPEQRSSSRTPRRSSPGSSATRPSSAVLAKDACASGAWCDPPLRGGIRLIWNGAGMCSAGFVVRSLSDSAKYLSTAGHCLNGRPGWWSTHFANGSSHNIGGPWSST